MIIRILFISMLFLLLNGCVSKQDSLNGVQKHTLKSADLKLLMHEMNMLVYEEDKSVLELDNARRRYALTLATNIQKISSQIKQLPTDTFSQNMDKEGLTLFNTYVQNLHQKGEDIYEIAQNYELEKLDNELQNLQRICSSCHSKFRGY